MTLTQLNAFVLVARLGSVTSAANALGVSEVAQNFLDGPFVGGVAKIAVALAARRE